MNGQLLYQLGLIFLSACVYIILCYIHDPHLYPLRYFYRDSADVFYNYSHKYPAGDVVIIAINLDPRNNLLFSLEDPLSKLKADAFILQPVGDITSK